METSVFLFVLSLIVGFVLMAAFVVVIVLAAPFLFNWMERWFEHADRIIEERERKGR